MHGQSIPSNAYHASSSATLIALSVSQFCSHQLHSLRDELWKTTGDPTFLSLLPLIPLKWIPAGSRIPPALLFPALQPPIAVRLDAYPYEGNLFLPVEDNGHLQVMREILSGWHQTIAEPQYDTLAMPLPFSVPAAGAAVYLGTDSSAARQRVREFGVKISGSAMQIQDFRLMTIDIQSASDWMRDIRYQIWQDRHLSLNKQDLW